MPAGQAHAIDESGKYPRELVRRAAALGLMGVTIPRDWGGLGLDYTTYALAIEVLAKASAVVSVIAAVNNSLVVEPLAQFGSDAQKEAWLSRLARGEALGAFALSEEHAGSDAANQQTAFNGQTQTFDLNGNLLTDGTNSYTWNARNQLGAISGPVSASFVYDALGRRQQKMIAGTANARTISTSRATSAPGSAEVMIVRIASTA